MPCAETNSPSFGRALSDVGNARLMTTSKPTCRNAAKSSGCGMPLVASRSSMRRKLRMWFNVLMPKPSSIRAERPHACAQAVGDVVRALERLLRRAERHHAQHRPENFLRPHAIRMRDAREKRRRKPIALRRERALRLCQLRAFVHAALHQLADFFELRSRIDRPDVRVFVERIA